MEKAADDGSNLLKAADVNLTVARVADSDERDEFVYLIGGVAAFNTMARLKEYLDDLSKGSTLTATWKGGLLLDERESSYPDGVQSADGTIYIIYDHQRYTLNRNGKKGVGSVVMARFHEDDVRAGRPVTDQVRLRNVITQLREE